MAEAVAAVALLFDDADLGEQLRSALQERGARIVHEGPLKGLSRELLCSVGADVLVVNLDDEDDSALDRLDEALEGDRPSVVFNDAQASRRLEGWDRARWARHLAMKVLAMGDADPPRPPAPAESVSETPAAALVAEPIQPDAGADLHEAPPVDEEARQAAVSETLAAELEALLASDAPLEEAEDFGAGLNYAAGEGAEIHDGSFGAQATAEAEADVAADVPVPVTVLAEVAEESPSLAALELSPMDDAELGAAGSAVSSAQPQARASFDLEHLELAPMGEEVAPSVARPVTEPIAAARISDNWALLDGEALETASAPPPPVERASPVDFGIEKISVADYLAPEVDAPVEQADLGEFGVEKVSAVDYLAPDADDGDSPVLPGLSLELVSLEEAIAPQDFAPSHEMVLDAPVGALRRLVVLGATTESTASVGEFLAALPAGLRATVLHTQHLAGRPAEGLVEYFASQCALPVRLAEAGLRAGTGEVIVVPSDRQVTLRRDGSIQLQPIEPGAAHVPSIDASFTQAAEAFGTDVIAIVFAGRSTDAVAGCQAVHDRGGQVWVEASGGTHASDMVSGVLAENLSHQAGTPRELAARLADYFPEGQP